MTRNPIRRTGLVLLSLLLPLSLSAEDEKDLRELLRDALYTEEVTRDPEAAAKRYEELLSRHDAQRAFAASALFRLAEVRRKQDRKDEAIALYQKLLARFPEAEAEAKLARENLAALGEKPDAGTADKREISAAEWKVRNQQREIEQLKELVESSPDLLAGKLREAVQGENLLVVEFLLSKGVDPATPHVLASAAGSGNLAICKLLLEKARPSPEEAGIALAEAIRNDRLAVLSHLLEQDLDPDTPVVSGSGPRITPLWVAVEAGHAEAARILLEHGADPDFMVNPSGDPGKNQAAGTALHLAVKKLNGLPVFRLLLERGAKPDLPTPVGGITPLHLAVVADDPQSEIMVDELLARGADPNRRSTVEPEEHTMITVPVLATPFEAALERKDLAKIRAMLAKGADLKTADRRGWPPLRSAIESRLPELVRELLKAGADPDGRDATGVPMLLSAVIEAIQSEGVGRSPDEHLVARARHREMVQVLLDAGADPSAGHQDKTPLREALGHKNLWPIAELLLERGAKPDEAWKKTLFDGADPAARNRLIRRYVFPEVAARPAISGFHGGRAEGIEEILGRKGDETPPPLHQLLLGLLEKQMRRQSHMVHDTQGNSRNHHVRPTEIRIIRHAPDVKASELRVDLLSDEPFPDLKWGDIIEFVVVRPAADQPAKSPMWSLRKRVAFPVTVEIEGHTRRVELRGDLLMFDPTSDRVPWVGAGRLMSLLWQPVGLPAGTQATEIVIERKGWPEIRLPIGTHVTDHVLLEPEDIVRLVLRKPDPSEGKGADKEWWSEPSQRLSRVTLTSPGIPYTRHFGTTRPAEVRAAAASLPTLLQALAETLAPAEWSGVPRVPADVPPWLAEHASDFPITILPHPDFSKIRLRRLQDSGEEEVLDIDLAAAIAGSTEATTAQEARRSDLVLRPGDIIELPLRQDRKGEPWKGLTPKETAFFAKALSCRVQFTDGGGNPGLREVRYEPPSFIDTGFGWYPLSPAETGSGTSFSLRASQVLGTSGHLQEIVREGIRDTKLDLPAGKVFLRDGDAVRATRSPQAASPTR